MNNKRLPTIESFNSDLTSVLSELEEGHYLFIIADKKKASLFLFDKGIVDKSKQIMDPSVQRRIRIDSGELYGKSTKLNHKIDNQIHKHLQLIIQKAEELIKGNHINGVFIGGHQPLFHLVEKELPKELQKKVRRTFVTELNIPEDELIAHCKRELEDYIK